MYILVCESKEILEVVAVQAAKMTAKGQITVPIDVRRRLGLNEGSRILFIEQENGFFVVNENRINTNAVSGAKVKSAYKGWPDDYIRNIMAFDAPLEPLFDEYEDIPWTAREQML